MRASRRNLLLGTGLGAVATGAALGGAQGSSDATRQSWRYATYGGWLEQGPGEGSLGRYNPFLTVDLGNGSYRLYTVFDRAEYDMLVNRLGVDHESAWASSWQSSAWSCEDNVPAAGTWAARIRFPATPGVGFAFLVWPKDDRQWPYGEIDIGEGVSGTNSVQTNLHWGASADDDQHDPQKYLDVDLTRENTYGVTVSPGQIIYTLNGVPKRTLSNSQVPADNPSHLVLQCGVDAKLFPSSTILDDPAFTYSEYIEFTPLLMP